MSPEEKEEIAKLASQYRPLGAWAYFWYTVLFSIPIIGQISLIVFALDSSNINRRSFARSYFCGFIILVIAFLILGGTILGLLDRIIIYLEGLIR